MNGIAIYLDSIRLSPPGGKWQFMWSKDKSMPLSIGLGFTFYIDFDKRNLASLMIIRENAELLEGLSIEKVSSLLGDFFYESITDIGSDLLFSRQERNCSVLDITNKHTLALLGNKIRAFLKERLRKSIFCMPVIGIPCLAEKFAGDLMWVPGNFRLYEILREVGVSSNSLQNGSFPPIRRWDGKRHPLCENDSWFIVRAQAETIAESFFRRMTGALSVVIDYPHSRFITDRQLVGGRITFNVDGSYTFKIKQATVPAVALPLKVKEQAAELFWKLCGVHASKRLHACLEYLADSWGKSRIIAFINSSIAMDALFGVNGKVKQSILAGVEVNCMSLDSARERYDLILKIRNSILHGEYSSLELSPYYLNYYEKYNNDPANDQIRILNDCLTMLAYAGQQPTAGSKGSIHAP